LEQNFQGQIWEDKKKFKKKFGEIEKKLKESFRK
jgi:hypothetical protein